MKRTLSILVLIFTVQAVFAQSGNLDNNTLNIIRSNYSQKAENDIAIRNALTNNDIRNLALNRDVVGKETHDFKYKVKVKGITDQKSSGRCWMFTGLNILRPQLIDEKKLSNFEFSTNYLYFYDMLEKSNLFLEGVLKYHDKEMDDRTVDWFFKDPITDGGVWNSFANLVNKYGLVPKTVMPETYHSENTRWLNNILSSKLREFGLELREIRRQGITGKKLQSAKMEMISEIYRILVLFLGEPPTEFTYRFVDKDNNILEAKTYTPQEFFKEIFPNYNTEDYYMFMNDPTREYYKVYEIDFDRNVLEGKNWIYLNLPSDEIKTFALNSIKNNEALYASCDVGKQLHSAEGTLDVNNYNFEALLGTKFKMDKAARIITYDSGSAHAMLLMACDTDKDDKPTKWQFENSWGSSHGHNGYLTFTDEWFDEYMFRVVVNKKFIDDKTLKLFDQKPILLPPWDPMFSNDN
ncbi:MAG TPA: C1 family peptidase [Bacteroidales bacterium]|nr:C1 family peptidase [Bacteroidales bacterium]HOR60638.1 C1 family peptidase [Bacteroidales bacterium]HPL04165.1 C1 family peptidase [Bacteroidales bacterium]